MFPADVAHPITIFLVGVFVFKDLSAIITAIIAVAIRMFMRGELFPADVAHPITIFFVGVFVLKDLSAIVTAIIAVAIRMFMRSFAAFEITEYKDRRGNDQQDEKDAPYKRSFSFH